MGRFSDGHGFRFCFEKDRVRLSPFGLTIPRQHAELRIEQVGPSSHWGGSRMMIGGKSGRESGVSRIARPCGAKRPRHRACSGSRALNPGRPYSISARGREDSECAAMNKKTFFVILCVLFRSNEYCRGGGIGDFDITTWTKTSAFHSYPYFTGHIFGNGRFLVRFGSDQMLTSSDGMEWTTNEIAGYSLYPVRFEGGIFIGSGGNCGGTPEGAPHPVYTSFASSPDGADWTWDLKTNFACGASPVAYGNGKFLSIASERQIMTSVDGKNWSDSGMKFPAPDSLYILRDLRFGNGRFVALYQPFAAKTYSMISTDGFSWTAGGTNNAEFGDGFYFGNGSFITANKKYSRDGLVWEDFELAGRILDIAVGAGRFFAMLADGRIAISVDAVNWQIQPGATITPDPNASPSASTIAYGNGHLVTGFQQLLTSPELCFVSIEKGTEGVAITVFGVPGKVYQIESRELVNSVAEWKRVGSVVAAPEGSATLQVSEPASETIFRARTN
jgi:hypothetical protein